MPEFSSAASSLDENTIQYAGNATLKLSDRLPSPALFAGRAGSSARKAGSSAGRVADTGRASNRVGSLVAALEGLDRLVALERLVIGSDCHHRLGRAHSRIFLSWMSKTCVRLFWIHSASFSS